MSDGKQFVNLSKLLVCFKGTNLIKLFEEQYAIS
jgi:hypothetical protein